MAKYRFECDKCNVIVDKYASVKTETLPCDKCTAPMKRLLPNLGSKKVTEVVDPYLGIQYEEDHKKQIEDRRTEHFWKVEVPRFVESGVYSLETCLAEGWLVYNEKGELVLGTAKKGKKNEGLKG